MSGTMASTTELAPGDPRSPEAAAFLVRFDRLIQLPLIMAAVVPLVLGFGQASTLVTDLVFALSWLVFLLDLVVHCRYCHKYLKTARGKFDLAIVVVTAPWFVVIPSVGASRFLVVVRFARLARLFIASRAARNLLERIGRAAIVAIIMVVVCAYVTFDAERNVNPEFATYWDSLWWGVETITTVGYGDKVPITAVGRWSAVVLMVSGVAIIGTLAGSLASFLRLDKREARPVDESTDPPSPALNIAELRAQIGQLDRQLAALETTQGASAGPTER